MLRLIPLILTAALALGTTGLPAQEFEVLFRDAEARLVEADTVSLDFEVTAEGAVAASLEGSLRRAGDRDLELRATGTFAGQEVDLHLTVEGETMTWGNGDASSEGPVPDELWPALAVGLTRMGILHNLARLVGGAPPDHADGGVGDWVVVDEFRSGSPFPERVPASAFSLTVAGVPSGLAVLVFDDDGLPLERHQWVDFPQGQMRVTERYTFHTPDPGDAR